MNSTELEEKARNELARTNDLPRLEALNLFNITTPQDADDLTVAVLVPKLARKFKRLTLCWDDDDIVIAYTISGQSSVRVTPGIEKAKDYLLSLFWKHQS